MRRTRRAHTKSHFGCDRCRRRRIKCDETGPPCSNCRTRGTPCEFSTIRVRQSQWSEPIQARTVSTARPRASRDDNRDENLQVSGPSLEMSRRMRELRLMHHWSLNTCFSFTSELGTIFQEYTVQQAFSHDFLMESLLAFTSLHLANETNDKERELYLEEALYYQGKAVPSFRLQLENINASNCNALFACSVIMMACAAVSVSFGLDDSQPGFRRVPSNLVSVFHFVKGINSVIDKGRDWLEDGPFRPVVLYDASQRMEPSQLSEREREILDDLRALCSGTNPALRDTYEEAIVLLEECFKTNGGMVIPWLVLVGDKFVNTVQEEDPLALLIYTCWAAALSRLTQMWWARAAGKSIVEQLVRYLPIEGKEWKAVVTWAKDVVKHPVPAEPS